MVLLPLLVPLVVVVVVVAGRCHVTASHLFLNAAAGA